MPPNKTDEAYLWDMLKAARSAEQYAAGKSLRTFLQDEILRAAIERRLMIVGEAARRVSESSRAAHPDIPWRQIVGQRNVLAHEYDLVVPDRIWNVVTQELPGLIAYLERVLESRE